MKSIKKYILIGFTLLFLISLIIIFLGVFTENKASDVGDYSYKYSNDPFKDFSETLWEDEYSLTILIFSVLIFASGTGILVLLRRA